MVAAIKHIIILSSIVYVIADHASSMINLLLVSDVSLSWNNAKEVCDVKNGNLLRIDSLNDDIGIREVLITETALSENEELWIGLHDPDLSTPGGYMWDGDPNPLTLWNNWKMEEPNNQNEELCVAAVFRKSSFEWFTANCQEKKRFLCLKPMAIPCRLLPGDTAYLCANDSMFQRHDDVTLQDCYKICLHARRADKGCWCTNFYGPEDNPNATAVCTIHEGDSQAYFMAPTRTPDRFVSRPNGESLYSKKWCMYGVSLAVDTNSFILDNSTVPKTDGLLPDHRTGSSDMVEFTIVKRHATWNEAACFCGGINASLVQMKSTLKKIVLSWILHSLSDEEAMSMSNFLWIGLRDTTMLGNFSWFDGTNDFDNWDAFQPQVSTEYFCSALNRNNTGLYWKSVPCSDNYSFICERNTSDNCSFEVVDYCVSAKVNSLLLENLTLSECSFECLSRVRDDDECWAVIHFHHQKQCFLLFSNHPFYYEDLRHRSNCSEDEELYMKRCLKYNVTNERILYQSKAIEPDANCSIDVGTSPGYDSTTDAYTTGTTEGLRDSTPNVYTTKVSESFNESTTDTQTTEPTERFSVSTMSVYPLDGSTTNSHTSNMTPYVSKSTTIAYTSETISSKMVTSPGTGPGGKIFVKSKVLHGCTFCHSKPKGKQLPPNKVNELKVDRKMTTAYKIKFTSASDDRASARNIGICGVVVITTIIGIICLSDMTILLNFLGVNRPRTAPS